uniref:Uncharacterized protein n=1 Tax=Parastrongyloides trichosuri TaxID=131310 RepID=A0A0N4Z7L2_PARTI
MYLYYYKSRNVDLRKKSIIVNKYSLEKNPDKDTKESLSTNDNIELNTSFFIDKEQVTQSNEEAFDTLLEDIIFTQVEYSQRHLDYVNQLQSDFILFNRDFEKALNITNPRSHQRQNNYNFKTQYLVPLHSNLKHHSDLEICDNSTIKKFIQ